MGQWILELRTTKNHVTPIVIKDENGAPINISGWFFKIEVEHDDGLITWSTVTGHFSIAAPTTDGKVIITVLIPEILTLPFVWAAFRFYAGPDANSADEIYEGKAHRI